jgi:hypothetical protein
MVFFEILNEHEKGRWGARDHRHKVAADTGADIRSWRGRWNRIMKVDVHGGAGDPETNGRHLNQETRWRDTELSASKTQARVPARARRARSRART